MLEDAPPKKPPDKIVLPYGPKVQTVKFPIETTEAKGNQAQTFIRQLDTATQLAPYKYLTKEEYKKTVNSETNKKKDPCDMGQECKQDIEIQDTPETPEDIINWEHKEKIAEAEGKIIKSDREWTPGYIPEKESNTEQKKRNNWRLQETRKH